MNKALLVHYDAGRIANEPGNKVVMKHFGHMPNLQLLYVAAILEKLGVEIMYVDMVAMSINLAELCARAQIRPRHNRASCLHHTFS
jgi:hypothetical protein